MPPFKKVVNRNTSGLWRGGSPGRPKGVPNKATQEAKAFCSSLVDDPIYQRNLRKRLKAGKLHPTVESLIWHYGKGKPREEIDLTVGRKYTPQELGAAFPDEAALSAALAVAKRLVAPKDVVEVEATEDEATSVTSD